MGIWFRGEGVGVLPAARGSVLHDFGEGVYFTDKVDVAKAYARLRAPLLQQQRVYSVSIEMKSMRILDLRTDSRWAAFTKPAKPGLMGIERIIQHGGNENYSRMFQSFLKANKINLQNFDAVIGPEYVRGGNQLCILSNSQKGVRLATVLRMKFRPVTIAGMTSSRVSVGAIGMRGRIASGLKVVGGTLAILLVSLLINWLAAKAIARMTKGYIEQEIEKLRPGIEKEIRRQSEQVLQLLAAGKPAFAVVSIVLTSYRSVDPDPISPTPVSESLPGVGFESVSIAVREDNSEQPAEYSPDLQQVRRRFKLSVPVTYAAAEIDLYRAFQQELQWYDAQMRLPLSALVRTRLVQERAELAERLAESLREP